MTIEKRSCYISVALFRLEKLIQAFLATFWPTKKWRILHYSGFYIQLIEYLNITLVQYRAQHVNTGVIYVASNDFLTSIQEQQCKASFAPVHLDWKHSQPFHWDPPYPQHRIHHNFHSNTHQYALLYCEARKYHTSQQTHLKKTNQPDFDGVKNGYLRRLLHKWRGIVHDNILDASKGCTILHNLHHTRDKGNRLEPLFVVWYDCYRWTGKIYVIFFCFPYRFHPWRQRSSAPCSHLNQAVSLVKGDCWVLCTEVCLPKRVRISTLVQMRIVQMVLATNEGVHLLKTKITTITKLILLQELGWVKTYHIYRR